MLDEIRVRIAPQDIAVTERVSQLFDFLDNNGGLTEEFLYQHQPTGPDPIPVYATNVSPIGHLDEDVAARYTFSVLVGPAIIVARKGYAGRLFVVTDERFVVQEDAYAIVPKPARREAINLRWFASHYSAEFQAMRTSEDGIGDFPRSLLRSRSVEIPTPPVQDRLAALYQRRDALSRTITTMGRRIERRILSEAGAI